MNNAASTKFSMGDFQNIRCPHCDGLISKDKGGRYLVYIRVFCHSRACSEDDRLPYVLFFTNDGALLRESIRIGSFYVTNDHRPFPQSIFKRKVPSLGCKIYKIIPSGLPGYLEDRYEIITTLSQPIPLPLDNLPSIEKEIISYAIFS